jgi:poly(3-hydroxybutyrate) depolymerase
MTDTCRPSFVTCCIAIALIASGYSSQAFRAAREWSSSLHLVIPGRLAALSLWPRPLMDPPAKLARPLPILYIHGDDDEQFSGFETNSSQFATTPHGNWITWGYLNGCDTQVAEKTEWGVRFSWPRCKNGVPVMANFVAHFGHEWAGSVDGHWEQQYWPKGPLNFTNMAWHSSRAATLTSASQSASSVSCPMPRKP